jgi:hypothetical protein
MAYKIRVSIPFPNKNFTLELYQIGNTTERYFFIPRNLINNDDAQDIFNELGEYSIVINRKLNDSRTDFVYFYFNVKVTDIQRERELMDGINRLLGRIFASSPTTTTIDNSFKFKVGDTFEDMSSGETWTIDDTIKSVQQYALKKARSGSLLFLNKKTFENDVANGKIKQIFVNQPQVSNMDILEELQKVKKGDVVKTTIKSDGSIYNEMNVESITKKPTFWSINGIDRGFTRSLYDDYWKELIESKKYDIQIIKANSKSASGGENYGISLITLEGIIIDGVNEKANKQENSKWDIIYVDTKNSTILYRSEFFVIGDVIKAVAKSQKIEYLLKIVNINILEKEIEFFNINEKSQVTTTISFETLFKNYHLFIEEYYNLEEIFDKPILVPKADSGTTPITPNSTTLSEIDQVKKDLGQLLFMRTLVSPIEFEQKIEITQLIDEKQKKINELNFKGIEEKMATDQFFDDLFEQSFIEIKHEYQGVYAPTSEATDFFTPNGETSDLSIGLNEIIRTPQFKEWFGDWELSFIYKDTDAIELECSKVLTSNYEPRVVWHGTGQEFSYFIFDKFPAAYFAVNREYSQFFSDLQGGGNGYVIPFFLNIRNPLDLTHFGTELIKSKEFFDYMYLTTGLTMEQLEVNPLFLSNSTPALETWVYIRNNPKMLQKIAQTHIYDGINFYESNPNVPDKSSNAHKTEAYIIFDANQCKIADPNRGMLLFASLKSFLLEKGGKI